MPFEDMQIPLSLKDYAEKRRSQSPHEIIEQYFDSATIQNKKEMVELSLLRLYFYLYYPDLSFEADWGMKMAYNMEMKDIIQGHINAHKSKRG